MPKKISTRIFDSIRVIFTIYPFEKLLLFFLRGTKYMGFWSKFLPGPYLYKRNSVRIVTRNNIKYILDISCLMQWVVYWDLKYKERDVLYNLVKPGQTILDVGTNMGETLLNFASLCGETGRVYGFEPDDENYFFVQRNISINTFKNVKVFKEAVSDKKEVVNFYCVDEHNRGMNRILKDHHNENSLKSTSILTTTIDDIVTKDCVNKIDLIKIDIEGYEMHALKGAINTLQKYKPVLFVEIGYNRLLKHDTSPNEIVKLLEQLGYHISHASTGERIVYGYDFTHLGDGGIDIVAIPC